MSIARLFHSQPPPHGFALAGEYVAYGRLNRARDRLVVVRRQVVPRGWFELGPVGVLHVDRAALDAAVAALLGQLESAPRKASVVVPNCWVRSLLVEVGELPRNRAEAEELLRWKLKKLLPCRPEEARLDFVPLSGNGRVWVVLALEKPVALAEEVFGARGVAVGRLEPLAMALLNLLPQAPGPQLLLSLDPGTVALLLVAEGTVRLVRHKLLPGAGTAPEGVVLRELATTVAFVRERQGVTAPLAVLVATADEALRTSLLAWCEEQEGIAAFPLALRDDRLGEPAGVDPVLSWALLATGMGMVD